MLRVSGKSVAKGAIGALNKFENTSFQDVKDVAYRVALFPQDTLWNDKVQYAVLGDSLMIWWKLMKARRGGNKNVAETDKRE